MKKNIFLFFLIIFSFSKSQVSEKTLEIIKPLEKYKSFYALNGEPKEIENTLEKFSSADELLYLANNGENSYIKAVAINVLTKKNDNRLIEIFKNNLQSQEQIIFSTECLSDGMLLPSYIFDTITSNPNLSEKEKESLTESLIKIAIDSQPVNTKLLEQVRYSIPTSAENYLKLRKQVIESRSSELLIALAKYKNPNDIELIKSFGENSFLAIEAFPDDRFLPFLNENIQNSKKFPFMFALSGYCNEEAKKIVDKVIAFEKNENKKIDYGNNCLTILYQQVYINKCSIFRPSLENLWLTDKVISFEILDNYEKDHSKEETLAFIMKGFLKDGEPAIIASNMYDTENMVENITSDLTYDDNLRLIKLLKKIKSLSNNSYNDAIRNTLKFIDDLNTDTFISKLNDNSIILQNKDVLLEKLRTNENAYGLISIMDGIKILQDKKLYDEGAKIVVQRKNEFLKSSIWEKSYKEFIRDNKIKE